MTDIDPAIASLNDALDRDPKAIKFLFSRYAPCNQALIDHPTVQVKAGSGNHGMVGLIGLINGALEPITGDRVAIVYNEEEEIIFFTKYSNLNKK